MVACCSAYGCSNKWSREQKFSFYSFPLKNTALCKKWIIAMRRKNFVPSKYSLLCSEHFEPSCFEQSGWSSVRRLRKDAAVPTIFKSFPPHLQPKQSTPRRVIQKYTSTKNSKKRSINEQNDTTARPLILSFFFNDNGMSIAQQPTSQNPGIHYIQSDGLRYFGPIKETSVNFNKDEPLDLSIRKK